MKRIINSFYLFLVFCFIFLTIGNTYAESTNLDSKSTTQNIYILNTGDIHEYPKYLNKISSFVHEMRKNNQVVFLVDSGDLLDQNPSAHPRKHIGYGNWSEKNTSKTKGNKIYEWASRMHYDAMLIGNHDLSGGIEHLQSLISKYNLPFIGVNIAHSKLAIPPYRIIKKKFKTPHGEKTVRIGIIGFSNQDVKVYHAPKNDKNSLKVYKVNSGINKEKVKELMKKCDIVVFLSHNTTEVDKKYLASMPDPSKKIIIGGHTHTVLNGKIKHKNAYIMKSGGPRDSHKNIGGELVGSTKITWDYQNKHVGHISMKNFSMKKY